MEFYINLFQQEDTSNNRPHFRALMTIDGVKHECAIWPNKDGKQGYSGKVKVKEEYTPRPNAAEALAAEAKKVFEGDEVPF